MVELPHPIPNCEVKHHEARLVPAWETRQEFRVPYCLNNVVCKHVLGQFLFFCCVWDGEGVLRVRGWSCRGGLAKLAGGGGGCRVLDTSTTNYFTFNNPLTQSLDVIDCFCGLAGQGVTFTP